MLARRTWCGALLLLTFVAVFPCGGIASAAEKRTFHEARFEKGQLKYVGNVPVLSVEGSPQEMGRQEAVLTGEVVKSLASYPRQLMVLSGRGKDWDKWVETAQTLTSHASQAHRDELQSYAAKSGYPLDLIRVANAIMDLHRGGYACSALMIDSAKSQTGGILFGRNLDFYTLGVLDRYGLVTVFRPNGKHAFATVGFPGLTGCISGMNDAGLAMAVHEVRLTADNAPILNPKAMPYTLCLRQILEDCTTIEQAEKVLRASERSTILSVDICSRTGTGVLEITPKTVALRRGSDGICVNTNHFRTDGLCLWKACPRYAILSRAASMEKLDVNDVFKKLGEVNQEAKTVQSMIFEPSTLVLHVAMGKVPATKCPLETVKLKPLLKTSAQKN